jgi:hypothetical protein
MSNAATRMRDKGRSWTEISETLRVSVAEAKQLVLADKLERREKLSQTQIAEDRNGLRDRCACEHERKVHANKEGVCSVCPDECEMFEQPQMFSDRWWRHRGIESNHDKRGRYIYVPPPRVLVDPDTQVSTRVATAAYQLGVSSDRGRAEYPRPRLVVKVRRARKRLAAGKPVYKSQDRRSW